MRLGVLPAAGRSQRWGGYPKELLPISSREDFLSRAVSSLQLSGCHVIVVITSPSKIPLHTHHLRGLPNVVFAIQKGDELWGAMATAIEIPSDEYFFMMPDTYLPERPFPRSLGKDLSMGLFETVEPERFGMLREGRIVDKEPWDSAGLAWGVLAWKKSVAQYWQEREYSSHTDALNDAIRTFGYGQWVLEYYYDIGTMQHYADFLQAQGAREQVAERFAALDPIIDPIRGEGRLLPSGPQCRPFGRGRLSS